MVLAVYKAAIIWQDCKFGGLNLVKVLIQDQILYFIVYVSCRLDAFAILMTIQ